MVEKMDMTLDASSLQTLDDIEELPGFLQLPTGVYRVSLPEGVQRKDINDHESAVLHCVVEETLELKEGDLEFGEKAPKKGDICDFAFMLDNKVGASNYKSQVASPLSEHLSTRNLAAIETGCKGMQVMLVVAREKNKESGKSYCRIKRLMVIA